MAASARGNVLTWFRNANVYYTNTARSAIYRAYSLLGLAAGDEVLVPAYNCGSEIDALRTAGAALRFYRISRGGEVDVEDLVSRVTRATKAVYVVHYFGFPQPLGLVSELCRARGLFLMEDCALSSFTEVQGRRIGAEGDVAVYNFPKTLSVPDGGALVVNNPKFQNREWVRRPPPIAGVIRNALSLIKRRALRALPSLGRNVLAGLRKRPVRANAGGGMGRLEMPGAYYFTPAMADRAMSGLTRWLLKRTDVLEVRERRRRNFARLLERISGAAGIQPIYRNLPPGVCPLHLPLVVERAVELAHRLQAQFVPAVAWWCGYHRVCPGPASFPDACYLKDHVLALPIHQQLGEAEIECVAQAFLNAFRR